MAIETGQIAAMDEEVGEETFERVGRIWGIEMTNPIDPLTEPPAPVGPCKLTYVNDRNEAVTIGASYPALRVVTVAEEAPLAEETRGEGRKDAVWGTPAPDNTLPGEGEKEPRRRK